MDTDDNRDNKGKFVKGSEMGRPKGAQDKTTVAAKELMMSALEDID